MGRFGASKDTVRQFHAAARVTTLTAAEVTPSLVWRRTPESTAETAENKATSTRAHHSLSGKWGSGIRNRIGCMGRFREPARPDRDRSYKKKGASASGPPHPGRLEPMIV